MRRLGGVTAVTMLDSPAMKAGRLFCAFRNASILIGLAGVFAWMYLAESPGCTDLNPESMSAPLTTGWLAKAQQKGIPVTALFDHAARLRNYKDQDPLGAFVEPFEYFRFEHEVYSGAFFLPLYMPFVRVFGVSIETIVAYSTFCAACATLLIAGFAWRTLGGRHAVFTVLSLFSNLAWLIHVKVGSPQPIPSAAMMTMLMLALHEHARTGRRRWLAACGIILGLMYLTGWIVFAYGLCASILSISLLSARRSSQAIRQVGAVAALALAVVFLGGAMYASWCLVEPANLHSDLFMMYVGRFYQGEPGFQQLTWAERMAYAFKCLFVDMQTTDGHVDKYLEGFPAIPLLTSVLFTLGLLYAIKEKTLTDRILLIWLVATFAPLGTIFIYSHRYALLGLPAITILSARGAFSLAHEIRTWRRGVAGTLLMPLLLAGMVATVFATRESYYVDYTFFKKPNFEMDRMRGHADVNAWLRANTNPRNTLVVLGDPVMFPSVSFLFHTFDFPIPFLFWSNYFGKNSTKERAELWEQTLLRRYQRIVYVFSTTRVVHLQCASGSNDWRAFRKAHPGLNPDWVFSYCERPPSIVLYCVEKKQLDNGPDSLPTRDALPATSSKARGFSANPASGSPHLQQPLELMAPQFPRATNRVAHTEGNTQTRPMAGSAP